MKFNVKVTQEASGTLTVYTLKNPLVEKIKKIALKVTFAISEMLLFVMFILMLYGAASGKMTVKDFFVLFSCAAGVKMFTYGLKNLTDTTR